MRCCGHCFDDEFLRREIAAMDSACIGRCAFCGEQDVPVVSPEELADHFERLASAYEDDDKVSYQDVATLLREDWGLFPNLDVSDSGRLVEQIFRAIPLDGLRRPGACVAGHVPIEQWKKLKVELMHTNRFFPQLGLGATEAELFGHLTAKPESIPQAFYRARILDRDQPFDVTDMGRPPKTVATHGRANPHGISYLYTAADAETAISEVRPHKGDAVCIANFQRSGEMQFADLCDPRKTITPFILEEEQIPLLMNRMAYLQRLGQELSLPVSTGKSHIEYLPTQYLCEFIKHCGFDGVIYRSSVGPGLNYAMFSDSKVEPVEVVTHKVTNVTFKTTATTV